MALGIDWGYGRAIFYELVHIPAGSVGTAAFPLR